MLSFFKQRDKQLHLTLSLALVLVVFLILQYLTIDTQITYKTNLLFSFIISVFTGVLKEIYDYFHPKTHTADWFDLLADFIGICLAVLIVLIYFSFKG